MFYCRKFHKFSGSNVKIVRKFQERFFCGKIFEGRKEKILPGGEGIPGGI
jgi:hypothetical protein